MIRRWTFGMTCCAALMATGAQAQSSVTLYGMLDAGFTYVNNDAGDSRIFFGEGINFGNRFGFRGVEDLGGGNAAVFTLESGFSLGTGALRQGGRMFGRQAFAGLRSSYGTVTLGRQYDFIREYIQQFNVGGYASVYAGHQGDWDRISGQQVERSVKFVSPTLGGGFSFGGMYGFGVENDPSFGRAWSVGAGYKADGVSVGATYTELRDVAVNPYLRSGLFEFLGRVAATIDPVSGEVIDNYGLASGGLLLKKQSVAGIGASYRFANQLTVLANMTAVRFDDGVESSTQYTAEAGAVVPLAPALTGIVAYQYSRFEGTHWNQPTVGLKYDLSKRTWLYTSASYLKASNGTRATQGAGFYLQPANKDNQTTFRVAMVHTF